MPIVYHFLGVVHNGMQVDNVFLKVSSRAIPGSLKASMSLTGATTQLFMDQPRVCWDKTLSNLLAFSIYTFCGLNKWKGLITSIRNFVTKMT